MGLIIIFAMNAVGLIAFYLINKLNIFHIDSMEWKFSAFGLGIFMAISAWIVARCLRDEYRYKRELYKFNRKG